jgi:uncharacterized RDD family membrane protein YckC
MIGDAYVQSVIDHVPEGLPLRDQIAMELRSHIDEGIRNGQSLDQILQQLGDPLKLAESYLAAVPMRSASVAARAAAKLIDLALVIVIVGTVALVLWALLPRQLFIVVPLVCGLGFMIGFVAYTAIAEHRHGRTLGKRIMGVHVVRESGARISLGQAFVRQLPFFGQFFFIDALFALFTERRQRAFELLTKTRAVALLVFMVLSAPGMV